MRELPGKLTAILLFLLLLFCIYRARTQSLTVDEAWVFQNFVDKPLAVMARFYDACNHVLHTLLMKWFRNTFGIAEIVLRIPSLIGAAVYLSGVYFFTAMVFSGWRQPVAAALLVLHPLVVDFMVAARGYGLALGLFMWALYCAVCYLIRGRQNHWLAAAGILGGLAVATNLTFAVPVAALGLALALCEIHAVSRTPALSQRLWKIVDSYFGPAFVIATLIVLVPLLEARRDHFYVGETSPIQSLQLLYTDILKSERSFFNEHGWKMAPFAGALLAVFFVAVCGMTAYLLWRRRDQNFKAAPFLVTSATLSLSGLMLLVLGMLGVRYPYGRTGLYLIPLFTLAGIFLLQRYRWAGVAGVLVALIYVSENDPRFFVDWRYDAGTREMIRRFDEDRYQRKLPEPVTLGVPQELLRTTEYYKLRRRMPWMEVKELGEEKPETQYVIFDSRTTIERAESLSYEVVAIHPLSGELLARRLP